jgi:hypothetical protein
MADRTLFVLFHHYKKVIKAFGIKMNLMDGKRINPLE